MPRVRITATDTIIATEPQSDEAVAAAYTQRPALVLDDLLDPAVLRNLSDILRQATFVDQIVAGLGTRVIEAPPRTGQLLRFLLDRAPLHRWLERVTGARPIASVAGKITQLHAGQGHHLDWHNDSGNERRVLGVTVNLGSEPYEGGRFEMRRRGSDEILLRHDHNRPGSALIFQVDNDLMHRVTPVTSGGPRTVFSGWFLSAEPRES